MWPNDTGSENRSRPCQMCWNTCQNRRSSRRLEDMTEDMVSRHMNSCLIKHETEHVSENFTNLWGMRHHMWQNTWLLSKAHDDEHLTPTHDQAHEHTSLTHQLVTGTHTPAGHKDVFSGYMCAGHIWTSQYKWNMQPTLPSTYYKHVTCLVITPEQVLLNIYFTRSFSANKCFRPS